MRLARRHWLQMSIGALFCGKICGETPLGIVGENVTEMVQQWNRRPVTPGFRPGRIAVRRVAFQINQRREGYELTIAPGQPIATPLVVGDRVYVGSGFTGTTFYCLDANSGKVIWSVQLSDNGPTAAAYEDGIVYVNTESCTLFALNATTGQQIWSWYLGDPLPTMPTVAHGRVFTAYPLDGTGTHALVCLEARTGRAFWIRRIDSEILSCPVADKEDVYVATFGGILYRFRQKDGAVLLAVRSQPTSAPVIVGNYVLYSRVRPGTQVETIVAHAKDDNHIVLETTQRGSRNWPQDQGANAAYVYQGSRPVYADGRIYVALGNAVHCLGAAHGMAYWSCEVGAAMPVALAGNAVVVAKVNGEILLLEPGSGEVRNKYDVGAPIAFPPAVDRGRIFAVTATGKLVCIKTGQAELTGWPCWGGHAHRNSVV
ncbi:MAG: PQQ-binding-like beta-propeller repeat protein [Gemmatales bacterium]|nr:PQQ-binding-like beta-propeller repeat protein [Gemmatales bacterium]MDW7994803.1 PQQ-binding-like beta-propeller repeat protein [Gemmatales bacterium]